MIVRGAAIGSAHSSVHRSVAAARPTHARTGRVLQVDRQAAKKRLVEFDAISPSDTRHIVRRIAIDEHRGDDQVPRVIRGDRRIGPRRQIRFVGRIRIRRYLRSQMTGRKDRRDRKASGPNASRAKRSVQRLSLALDMHDRRPRWTHESAKGPCNPIKSSAS